VVTLRCGGSLNTAKRRQGIMNSTKSQMEPEGAVYKTLLESTKAIPWKIDWASKQFTYIGPQIQELLGWTPESWMTVNDWADRMHPEDREAVVTFCVAQSQAGVDHEADYRALTRDGGYVWIRDVVHVVRKDGEVESLVGFMFDISERKRIEEEVQRLQHELEALSFRDGLTDVSNRRMFDQVMEREWFSAYRSSQPLSLILLDIDFFKQFNDHYGHLAGDECLKRVANLLDGAASRPRDFVARYGGEEFVLVLPETEADAAAVVAERCRELILGDMIPHEYSEVGPYLSISLGVSTITPTDRDSMTHFISTADQALSRAKQGGRNRASV